MAGGGLVDLGLVRAWEAYFRQKGGGAPNVPPEVVPVIILDDNSRGPYPAYRSFIASRITAFVAAQFAYVGLLNNDVLPSHSVVVCDEIIFISSTVQDAFVGLTTTTVFGAGSPLVVQDTAEEKDQAPSDRPPLGNVLTLSNNSAVPLSTGATEFPGAAAGVLNRIAGPFTLGPQGVLYLQTQLVNTNLQTYFRGRYYPSV